jgi:biotin transport system ATP-binding protein
MKLLETRHLSHRFPNGTLAIDDVNLAVNEGEFLVLAGKNGSGKTVLVRHFNGLLLPTVGEVLFQGEPITKNLTEARKKIGLIFQDPDSQIVGQTVAEDVAFGPENLCLPRTEVDDRVRDSLNAVGLNHLAGQRPQTLSGGQKRRLAVAGVLAMKPRLIIFDEPFAGLDYPGVIQVLRQIVALSREGHTIIAVTHELEKILAHANRLMVMEQGRVVLDGVPVDLLDRLETYGIKRPCGPGCSVETMTWLS